MNHSFFRLSVIRLLQFCLVAVIPFLSACETFGPGMHVNSRHIPDAPASTTEPVVKAITPELVKAEREQREKRAKPDLGGLIGTPASYRIGKGDILSITPWGNPELTAAIAALHLGNQGQDATGSSPQIHGFVVDQEGLIQFPYVGSLKVDGLTVTEARELLLKKLRGFYKRPEVSMRVQVYRSKRIYVGGEVKNPGVQPINDIPMTLMEALNRAGGITPSGDQSSIYVNRSGTSHQVNLPQLIEQGIDPSSIILANGDVVRVRSRDESKVFVMGEVIAPRALSMHDGNMTLNQALGEVGGLNLVSASGRQLYVIRNASGSEPLIYHLDASSPFSMALAENFALKPRDVVYVNTAPLAQWNRMISLILPSALSVANTSASFVTGR